MIEIEKGKLNPAQQLLKAFGIPYTTGKELKGKNPSFTKCGPGRKHKQGY